MNLTLIALVYLAVVQDQCEREFWDEEDRMAKMVDLENGHPDDYECPDWAKPQLRGFVLQTRSGYRHLERSTSHFDDSEWLGID